MSILDYASSPPTLRLYVEDLGGGNHAEIFSSKSAWVWPVGWHQGKLGYTYQDQAMDPAAAHAMCDASDPVHAFACDAVLWGPLAGDARLIAALREARERVNIFMKESPP